MTKVITAAIILLVLWGGWELFFYWERVKNQEETQRKQAQAARVLGENLPGIPYQASAAMESSLRTAQAQGTAGLRNWLKTYGYMVQDPRKAWIELDYCQLLSSQDPSEARKLFAQIKARTPQTSPVWPRIKEMSRTYE